MTTCVGAVAAKTVVGCGWEIHEIELAAGSDASRLDVGEREHIEQALAALPDGQRAMLAFVALDDLSVAEAGRLLGK